jgi:glutamyl-tRNA reductase
MNLVLIGINHRTAPLEIRERLWFSDADLTSVLGRLRETLFSECFIVSTCNRTEMYGVIDASTARQPRDAIVDAATRILLGSKSAGDLIQPQHLYRLFGCRAAVHLLKVASGIDSMVIGDIQILGQIKHHYTIAFDLHVSGAFLNRLVQTALHAGKRARAETGIGRGAVSVSYAAVELATKIFSNLSGKTILLIGAGETGELTAKHLVDRGISSLLVANRTPARAVELVGKLGGTVIPFDEIAATLPRVDVVLSSVSAASYVLDLPGMRNIMKARSNSPLILIDLGVPRNIDPEINSLDNVFVYDIDSLCKIVAQNLERRKGEITAINGIILDEIKGFRQWYDSLQVGPTINDLRSLFEKVRSDEVNKFAAKFAPQDRELLNLVTTRIINKLLHGPSTSLKNGNGENSEEQRNRISTIRSLFGLRKGKDDSQVGEQE